uniref:EGF-like calcium-binding domain-containing protein n=1 Tax=Ditylenchus dipsaci TaxID=166011 RepID=A0A915DU04_9BILA
MIIFLLIAGAAIVLFQKYPIINDSYDILEAEKNNLREPLTDESSQSEVDLLVSLGQKSLLAGDPDEAIDYFTKANQLQPKNAHVLSLRADAYSKMEKWDLSRKDADAALALDPTNRAAFLTRDWALRQINPRPQMPKDTTTEKPGTAILIYDPMNPQWEKNLEIFQVLIGDMENFSPGSSLSKLISFPKTIDGTSVRPLVYFAMLSLFLNNHVKDSVKDSFYVYNCEIDDDFYHLVSDIKPERLYTREVSFHSVDFSQMTTASFLAMFNEVFINTKAVTFKLCQFPLGIKAADLLKLNIVKKVEQFEFLVSRQELEDEEFDDTLKLDSLIAYLTKGRRLTITDKQVDGGLNKILDRLTEELHAATQKKSYFLRIFCFSSDRPAFQTYKNSKTSEKLSVSFIEKKAMYPIYYAQVVYPELHFFVVDVQRTGVSEEAKPLVRRSLLARNIRSIRNEENLEPANPKNLHELLVSLKMSGEYDNRFGGRKRDDVGIRQYRSSFTHTANSLNTPVLTCHSSSQYSHFAKLIIFYAALSIATVSCKKCNFEDEAMVVYCSNPLISEHLDFKSYKNGTDTEEDICKKYDAFNKCLDDKVTSKCRMKSLPNMLPLWEYLCSPDYKKMVTDEHSCYKAIEKDLYVQKCFQNSNYSINLNQIRHNGGEQFCRAAKSHLECYKEFSHLEKCQQAVTLQKSFYEFLSQNYTSNDADTKPTCQFIDIEKLVQDFKVVQKEKAIGGCDEFDVCKCIDGYTINNDTKKCVDIDECSTGLHSCSQKCINKEGGYDCECDTRFYTLASTTSNHTCIRSNSSAPVWLIFAHGQSIWNVSDDGKFVELKHAGLEKVAMLDVDVKVIAGGFFHSRNTIYFVDNGKNLIQRVAINANQSVKPEVIQNYEVDGVEGIAVDYIARNLYTARKSDIFVQSLDGRYRMRIYKNKLSTPRALVLHSDTGMLYGSDWSSAAFLYKAATDGSYFQKIVTTDIVWPNGLTIDSYANRIYWADAFLDTIQSMDMNGGKRKTILANSGAVAHLFGLAVADDYIYWTDWNHRGILRADKLTGQM